MGRVRVAREFTGTVHEAERCWCDTARWAQWVAGLGRVVEVSRHWPREGSNVVWESVPAGRGRVHERVTEHEALRGLTVAVEDDSITGVQRVSFDPVPKGVRIELSLEYSIKRRSPLTPLVDWLFVRRPMTISLSNTLERFGVALAESRRSSLS